MREQTINGYLGQLAARVPAPGGGAAAALHAAQAAALVEMVAGYTTGAKYSEHADLVEEIRDRAAEARLLALELAVADADAFSAVAEAYKLPKDTDGAKAARRVAIQSATIAAAEPPAATIGAARLVLGLAERLFPVANRNVISDIAAAADAARAAVSTARVNVEINLAAVKDQAERERLAKMIDGVDSDLAAADALVARVREVIG